ncbi:hypothetical protein HNR46_003517 [Haloferula luteola]|uniref:Uncharacterized protein n=1 Tax=Haloferula luteola TaxID=595692 RepID=A0A840V5L7_9BACT|nr:hypothetical protein [Haloferula luteola]MBB5353262.1 hypothetical protein [Haloferula luteola]
MEARFEDEDWEAVRYGMQGTSDLEERWFDYPLRGQRETLCLSLALDEGGDTDIVLVKISGEIEAVVATRIMTLIEVCSRYEVGDFRV